MGSPLPPLDEEQFRERLLEAVPTFTPGSGLAALFGHYVELRRWNRRLSLVGPGTSKQIVERHYGESLTALSLIRRQDRRLVDLGSGAGFPGLILAIARRSLEVTLVESRARKWAFLMTVCRRCELSCRCLNVRVERPLPEGLPCDVDVFTCRALAISPEVLEALSERSPRARFLFWRGVELPPLPVGYRVGREIGLQGSDRRRIVEVYRASPPLSTRVR